MKLPKKPTIICHHFNNVENYASFYTLVSSFFTSQSIQVSQTRQFSTSSDPSSGSIIPISTNLLLFINHSPVKKAFWEARSSIFWKSSSISSSSIVPSTATSDCLIAKTPSRSKTSVLYKFSSDSALRERYRNPMNEIRIEKLLEDLDALAGTISYKHCSSNDGTARSLTIVTASVDNVILKMPIRIDSDLTIEGAATWVGCSSLEIQLDVKQSTPEASNTTDSVSLTANFTFVARDSKTGKSAKINAILPETKKEKHLWQEAEQRNKMRKKKKEEKKDNLGEKINRLSELLLADRDTSILIKETCLQNSLVCQPEQKNIHGQIFGGYLMRKAFELAYATAYAFAGSAPCFVKVNHVDFLKPVDVGDFLHLKSCVLYTQVENSCRPLINVEVVAHVTQPQNLSTEVSNNFYFTFTVPSDTLRNGLKIRNVVPGTEEEARRVIEYIDVVRNKRKNEMRLKECA
ncbi:acyl-coenzyme A thioesterase 2, chloroplastic-like [Lycium barbarum]|uniref:acyl-coenzyme A thioesterase 2, chloroplastic-like n=1 Tax=Lycium barbarum TaxID=112863 RepID=UPI00293F6B64|nr:acyl-coenzyme A thioesterase 2, chloroplastic-like [Lycium barbarum]